MEIKHQLQGNDENYLNGYLHSKADGTKVLLLFHCKQTLSWSVLVITYFELQAKVTGGIWKAYWDSWSMEYSFKQVLWKYKVI